MESEKLTTCWDYNVILCSLTHVRNSKLATQLESAISKKAVDLILADNAKNIFHVNCTWAVDLRSNATHCNLSQNISGLMHSESTSGRLSTTAAVKQAKQIIDMVASAEPPTHWLTAHQGNASPHRPASKDNCFEFRNAAFVKRRTQLYFLGDILPDSEVETSLNDVTLATQ
jgi:hypothetical protein